MSDRDVYEEVRAPLMRFAMLAITGYSTSADAAAAVWTSTDGQTWQAQHQDSLGIGVPTLDDVTNTPHGWLAVGRDGSTYRPGVGAAVSSSVDGAAWVRYPTRSLALSPDPSPVEMTDIAFGNGIGVAGGVTGEECVERFAQCNLDVVFWTWEP